MNQSNNRIAAVCLSVALAFAAMGTQAFERSNGADTAADSGQDPAGLDRRISMLEQRFYILETSLRRVEQQTTMQRTQLPDQQTTDLALLRIEIERLKGHIQTVECGVARLDERTLPAKLRQSAREDSSYKDPCRLNPESPLHLPSRP